MAASDATSATERGQARERAAEYLLKRHRFRPTEALPWLIAIGVFFVFPDRMTFGSQVLVMVMFAPGTTASERRRQKIDVSRVPSGTPRWMNHS